MPITVGSVGDIIALIQLAASVKKCLSDSCGSSADFQSVVELMDSLQETLLGTQNLIETIDERSNVHGPLDIYQQRRLVVAQSNRCRTCIEMYMKRIQKYGKSLNTGGSKNAPSDIFRKLKWGINEKDTLERFRREVETHLDLLSLQTASLGSTVDKYRHDIVQTNFSEASDERQHIASITQSHLVEIKMRLGCVMPGMATDDMRSGSSLPSIPFAYSNSFALPMDQFWIWKPVIVRDPLGRQWPFPIGLLPSWGAMQHAFSTFFENTYTEILDYDDREYHLYNARLGRFIHNPTEFDLCFQPGDYLFLIFIAWRITPSESCPTRCDTRNDVKTCSDHSRGKDAGRVHSQARQFTGGQYELYLFEKLATHTMEFSGTSEHTQNEDAYRGLYPGPGASSSYGYSNVPSGSGLFCPSDFVSLTNLCLSLAGYDRARYARDVRSL